MPAWLTRFLATGLYSGLSPSIPGTTGTIPAWVLLWFFFPGPADSQMWTTSMIAIQVIVLVIAIGASVRLASDAELLFGHDSKKIVIDEWAGMVISVLFLPHTLTAYLLAFGAFRLFDVIKIWPAAQLEKLPQGWGVTMDDVAAGVQANICTQIIILIIAQV